MSNLKQISTPESENIALRNALFIRERLDPLQVSILDRMVEGFKDSTFIWPSGDAGGSNIVIPEFAKHMGQNRLLRNQIKMSNWY
jgi:hypothetical protein